MLKACYEIAELFVELSLRAQRGNPALCLKTAPRLPRYARNDDVTALV